VKGETPKCTLKHVTYGERPKYEALSYTWGDETQRRDIHLGGHTFSVTKNLYEALCCLRHASEPRQLWVDAICINQTDIPEKNRQLYLMPFIYERAKTVLVWLGLYETRSAPGSSTSPSISEEAQPVLDQSRLSSDDQLTKAICCNPYWDRLWIIQEVAKARWLMVHLNDSQMEWEELLPLLHDSPYFSSSRMERMEYHLANKYEKFYKLEHLLEAHKNALCREPRDKVYGLLGLDPGWLYFTVDYQKSLYQIWKDTVHYRQNVPNGGYIPILPFARLVKACLGVDDKASSKELALDLSVELSQTQVESIQIKACPVGHILRTGPSYSQVIKESPTALKWRQIRERYFPELKKSVDQKENDLLLEAVMGPKDLEAVSSCSIESQSSSNSSSDPNSPDNHSQSTDGVCLYLLDGMGRWGSGIGLAPSNAQEGDWIYLIDGAKRIAVLRPAGDKFRLIGTAVLAPGPLSQQGWVPSEDESDKSRIFNMEDFPARDGEVKQLHLSLPEVYHLL
jgi:hypothetical protein